MAKKGTCKWEWDGTEWKKKKKCKNDANDTCNKPDDPPHGKTIEKGTQYVRLCR